MCGGLGVSPEDLSKIRQCSALQPNPKVKITQQVVRDWLRSIRPPFIQQRLDLQ